MKENTPMGEDLERLKHRLPLLEYLQRHHWTPHRAASRQELVGRCPLHPETRPSFYVNTGKNLFYCHSCGRGGDLIRFVELRLHLSFRQSVAHLERELAPVPAPAPGPVLEQAAAFYQLQLGRHPEATQYLAQRGLREAALIAELGLGYAPGGTLRRHLTALGYSHQALLTAGLINAQGRDTFYRQVIFPCRQQGHVVNLYGRSLDTAFRHRLLARSKGGLFAWEAVRHCSTVLLVEGLFDLAALWQAGFRHTTCAFGTHLNSEQWAQLGERPDRLVHIVFDADPPGQRAARQLAQRLQGAGCAARLVPLPAGHDPDSYFRAGATAADFQDCLAQAHQP
jgi:DNA primase